MSNSLKTVVKNETARNILIRSYKDLDEIQAILNKEKLRGKYYYIQHTLDKKADNELVKPHIHIILRLENRHYFHSIIDRFELIKGENIQVIGNITASIRYLIHFDNQDKYQYDINEIVTNDLDIKKYFKSDNLKSNEADRIALIDNLFDNIDYYLKGEISYRELLKRHSNFLYRLYNLQVLIKMRAKELGVSLDLI